MPKRKKRPMLVVERTEAFDEALALVTAITGCNKSDAVRTSVTICAAMLIEDDQDDHDRL